VLVDFIRQNPAHLRVDPSQIEPGSVAPNPASWHRLAETYEAAAMSPATVAGTRPEGFYALATGFIGFEAAIALTEFVEKYEMVISAEDIVNNYDGVKDRVDGAEASTIAGVIEKVTAHCKDNEWKAKQAKNVAAFAGDLGGEMLVQLWNSVSTTQNLPNIQKLHKLIGQKVVKAVQASRNV